MAAREWSGDNAFRACDGNSGPPWQPGLDSTASKLLRQAVERFRLSMRAYGRIRKVARTVADLAGHDAIQVEDVALALQFRTADGPYGG